MKKIREKISSKKIRGISDYFNMHRYVQEEAAARKLESEKNIKIAILPSFTANGIKEVLSVKCCELGIFPTFHVGEYSQYFQEILNPDSSLYKFNPDLIIVFIETRTILGEDYLLTGQFSDKQRKDQVDRILTEMQSLIQKIKENSIAKILFHNFEVPQHSPMGIHENKQKFGLIESIERINAMLREAFKNDKQVFIFDYESFCSKVGKQNIVDPKMYYLADLRLNLQYLPNLCDEYFSFIKPLLSCAKKCIVLDLDNTLWGGIIGEDDLEGIKLGPTVQGRPYWDFQKYLFSLFNRGVILAVNSMNNYDEAIKVFREHPYMILKEQHFAAIRINWNDKVSNIRAIAKEINIGLDSIVFIDDDKRNREMVRSAIPEVLVIDLPGDPSLYLKTLMEINDFNTLQITEEDMKRSKLYVSQRKRQTLHKIMADSTSYLKALKMQVIIEEANPFNIPRISQLTQKTNQFNMTTRRYQEEDIKRFTENDNFFITSLQVKDRFGDNGITGLAIVERRSEKWRIDTFLLSCRIIGRRIEEILLGYILKKAKKQKAKILIGEFIPTKKNTPAKDFFKNSRFKLVGKDIEKEIWEYDVNREYGYPDFFDTIERK